MFKEIFLFELKQWLKRPAYYIYFAIFVTLAFLIGAVISGIFGATVDTNSHINSASTVAGIFTAFNTDYLLGLITLLISVALMAGAVQKDFQYNCFSFYFTKPITKFGYLVGRFSASFLLTLILFIGLVLGIWLAMVFAPNDNGQLGEFKFMNFFQPFVLFLLPNAFLIGAVFFSLVTFTRNMVSGYVGSLVFIVTAGIARSITSEIENKAIGALLDPFGQLALGFVTDYWTPAESNTRMVPFSSYILYNRLLWVFVSLLLLSLTYFKFNFSQFLNPVSLFKRKSKESTSQPSKLIQSIGHLPKVSQTFNLSLRWQQLRFLTAFEYRKITRSVFFYIIIGLSVLLTALTSQFSGLIYGTETYPLTYMQIESSGGIFRFFLLILIVFYSGIVVWRERDSKADELVGASPVRNSTLFISKSISLALLCLSVHLVCIITCLGIQTYQGYHNYEIGLYITEFFGLKTISMFLLVLLSVSLQVFFKNRYVAYFTVVIIVLALPLIYRLMHISSDLTAFNSSGHQMAYSDMNGHGHTLGGFLVYKLYWTGFMLIISSLAVMMYQRGKETGFLNRFKLGKKHLRRSYILTMMIGSLLFLGCGSVIFYNSKILNPEKTDKEIEKLTAEFEKKYKKYEAEPQPRVVESNVNVDIFPEELRCKMNGFYYLKNKHQVAVNNIFINIPYEAVINEFKFNVAANEFLKDKGNGFYGFKLNKSLLPGDSIKFNYSIEYVPKNFIIKKEQTEVVYNGSFFNSRMLPTIGYDPNSELSENSARKRYKLAPKPRMASITDTSAYANTYISNDADWIRFECVVSTSNDQTAIAPGYLQKEWKENNRHYFHYKMDAPIFNFYAFLSARYEVKKDVWVNPLNSSNKVNVEIYYNKGHEYNIDKMISGVKKSLDYYTKNFSPYQHKQVRILEFPRYATFAQSFPNTIPFSEGIGFVARLDEKNPDQVDYPFYVTAHEVAHQWWAHQVIGANVQGCTLMSETMSQYSALMVMEKEYGQSSMSKFLKYEMNTYLQGRSREGKKEVPLLLCENQQYIHYNKGSLVMYALKDYIGEDSLNSALRKYIKKVGFQEPPFTTALEFYDFIKKATPDSLQETIKDLFERIVVFDNAVDEWSYVKTPDGKFKVSATIICNKTRNDTIGKSSDVTPADWIDIGVFSKNEKNQKRLGNAIYVKKFKISSTKQKIEFLVDQEPFMLGVDPYSKLIDKDTGNNIVNKFGVKIGGGAGEGGVTVSARSDD